MKEKEIKIIKICETILARLSKMDYEPEKKDCSVISLSIPKTLSIKDRQFQISKSITSWYLN